MEKNEISFTYTKRCKNINFHVNSLMYELIITNSSSTGKDSSCGKEHVCCLIKQTDTLKCRRHSQIDREVMNVCQHTARLTEK